MVRRNSENCHLNLSLSAVCDCGISWSNSLTIVDVSAVGSVKQNLSGKECDKAMRLLSCFASSASCCGLFCSVWLSQFLVVLTYFLNYHFLYSS